MEDWRRKRLIIFFSFEIFENDSLDEKITRYEIIIPLYSWKPLKLEDSFIENPAWISSWASPTMVVSRGREMFQSCERILEWGDHYFDDLYTPTII